MSAVCVRARAQRKDRPRGIELADVFCHQARLRVEELFAALWNNTDALDVKVARRVLDDGATPSWRRASSHCPRDRAWIGAWQPGSATVDDVRRRIRPSA
jgi:hypothetical protein